jgi:hypothetical protein
MGNMSVIRDHLDSVENPMRSKSGRTILRFPLTFHHDSIFLQLTDEVKLGHLQDPVLLALRSLPSRESLIFEAIVRLGDLRDRILADRQGQAIITSDIHISGPMALSRDVGQCLSKYKVWLQQPDHQTNYIYDNPHKIRFPEMDGLVQYDGGAQAEPVAPQLYDGGIEQIVQELQTETHRNDNLERVTGDRRLRIPLLP